MNRSILRQACRILCYCTFLLIYIRVKLRRNLLKCLWLFKMSSSLLFFPRHNTVLLVRAEHYLVMGVKIMCIVKIQDTTSCWAMFLENLG